MHSLFRDLIWPAVTGNIVWSFFSVAIDECWTAPVYARMLALALLGGYLMTSWVMERDAPQSNSYYWLDSIFAVSIVSFAISTQAQQTASLSWVTLALGTVFSAAFIGHVWKIWEPDRPKCERHMLAGANLVGVAVLLLGYLCYSDTILWHRPLAIFLVVAIWFAILRMHPRQKCG